MYIKYKEKTYPCESNPSSNFIVYSGLPEDFPAPVCGEIILCADDDFIMRTDNSEEYMRQTFEGGVLTLTNEPEPVLPPAPEPVPTVWDELDKAYQEGVDSV